MSVSASKPAPTGTRLMHVIVDKKYAELIQSDALTNGLTRVFAPIP